MRKGSWKLHEYFESGDIELYNLEKDPGETNNLAAKHKEKAEELLGLLHQWRNRVGAPVPKEVNTLYDPAFEKNLIKKKTL